MRGGGRRVEAVRVEPGERESVCEWEIQWRGWCVARTPTGWVCVRAQAKESTLDVIRGPAHPARGDA
jgi:hypothetical protein